MIIILNGPPGCGKDTLASLLSNVTNWESYSFKIPMWSLAEAALGKRFPEFCSLYDNRETKELPVSWLGGRSPRQFFIHISENWCKPVFGEEYFGERALEAFQRAGSDVIVSDGGFPRELYPALKAGMRVLVVRLHREGYTYKGDSRRYLTEQDFECLPVCQRPIFTDVEVVEGLPRDAAQVIHLKATGQRNEHI